MDICTISKLVNEAGVSVYVVRDYVARGLLRPARRSESGYGLYDNQVLERLRLVRSLFEAGTLQGALGTKPVLLAVGAVVSAQLIFTYLPLMNRIFASRPLSISEFALILSSAAMLVLLLEGEKRFMHRLGWFEELRAERP